MNLLLTLGTSAIIFSTCFTVQALESPNGFIVWSEGSGCERELKFNRLERGNLGPKQIAVELDNGVDIGVKISFDGKWIAFGRTIGFFSGKYGKCDCMAFDKFDIYIARVDGALPAKPIKIGRGYWPAWGDDSHKEIKTLYFTVFEKKAFYKTTIRSDGSFSTPEVHVKWPPKIELSTMEISPNGRYIAHGRIMMKIWDIQEGKEIPILPKSGGYFPNWGPRSKYLVWRSGFVCKIENGRANRVGDPKIGGRSGLDGYWPVISNDVEYDKGKLWIIGQNYGLRNRAYPLVFKRIDISDGQWIVGKSTEVGKGTSADIHISGTVTKATAPRDKLIPDNGILLLNVYSYTWSTQSGYKSDEIQLGLLQV